MILVYGRGDDPPTLHTLEALQAREAPLLFLDQRALAYEGIDLEITGSGVSGELRSGGRTVPLEQITAVFARPLEPSLRGLDAVTQRHVARVHELLVEWLDIAPCLVVNRPWAMQSNASKPHQLQQIGAAGFRVPSTLITSQPEEAMAFWKAHGRIIYKSISGVRSIVQELDSASAQKLPLLAYLPVQFQEYIGGVDVRVHVVGHECYAARIESEGIDYRYAHRQGNEPQLQPTTLADEIAERCVNTAELMGLPLAGIDLRIPSEEEPACLEVNPMPAYSYFENHTGLPIAEALARMLSSTVRT